MFKYLFFDDQRLYKRSGLDRKTAKPTLISDSVYSDGICRTDLRTPFVFKCDDGKYRMVYEGKVEDGSSYVFLSVSDDGIHFEPEDLTDKLHVEDRIAKHELFRIKIGEIAEIFEDTKNLPEERYKMLFCDIDSPSMSVHGVIYTSPDLIHWTLLEGVEWSRGPEPIVGVFYNKKKECYTITMRPDWGVRKVGYVDTKDWRTFSSYEICLQTDPIDSPLTEIYGMPAIEYNGYYIGFPILYRGFKDDLITKFMGGTIESELAYSFDGHHWQRSVREPFITGLDEQHERVFGHKNNMLWISDFLETDDGILIYCSATKNEHGVAFSAKGDGKICVMHIKNDRFISLNADNEGVVATRENLWTSGEVHVNLCAEKATLAVYESCGNDYYGGAHPIDGYAHEDCLPFSGDSTDWIPQFKNGKKLEELKGKTLILEIKIQNGDIYSLTCDCIPLMNLQGVRYRELGLIPDKII